MNLLQEYGIEPDPRFKMARKESLVILLYWILYSAWTYLFAYFGTLTPPEEYNFIFGFPAWYFWACLGAGFVFPLIGIVLAFRIKDCSLVPWLERSHRAKGGADK